MLLRAAIAMTMLTAVSAGAEIVTTTDGRKIELKEDGTYMALDGGEQPQKIEFSVLEPFFEHFAGEYGQNSMRFMPIVRNKTGKTVVGFKFKTEFRSAFDEVVFSFEGESSEKVPDGATSTAGAFYYFEDNQFIGEEPYDKLKIFEAAGTGSTATKIIAVVFDDGKVLKVTP